MSIEITPSGQACGAAVTGIDLCKPLGPDEIAAIRSAWLEHHVVSFPDQILSDDDLERFTLYFGAFGEDPFIAPIQGREHVIAVQRLARETAPLFAESWHTDWSFQAIPPAATCLYGKVIPPQGGDTWFSDQHQALANMPDQLRDKLENKLAIHSAKAAYAPDGMYGEKDKSSDRSMMIVPSDEAAATQLHPLLRAHPETGQAGVYGCVGYIVGIDGMSEEEALDLLMQLHEWQTRPEFHYRHQWRKNMLVMWDNRSVLHRATGGYEGYDRILHRTTVADSSALR
ncbi:MAG: taurine dioxygenase [Halieaceae bacterium]|jgi:taurine dioxygenase